MWNVEKHIAHHEKMVRILEMIDTLNNRILSHLKSEKQAKDYDFFGIEKHNRERVKINEKMKERLINYYNNQRK